ncbi:hypothetical protein [Dyadobacter psychrotolerans]|uniref:hypothetical protein n=1 Tax=Dyadobacter psychrotolerans TaxID=2541721 RepID=UPI001404F2DF|nr:hypothetical protein [Dyadobacter psychrotolerans]
MNTFDIRMRIAALRQYLRDNQTNMSQKEIDDVLDVMSKLIQVLNDLENKKN